METCEFRYAFGKHLMNSVADEQVQRVLAYVLGMIRAGKFDRLGKDVAK